MLAASLDSQDIIFLSKYRSTQDIFLKNMCYNEYTLYL